MSSYPQGCVVKTLFFGDLRTLTLEKYDYVRRAWRTKEVPNFLIPEQYLFIDVISEVQNTEIIKK